MHIEIWSDVICPFCYIGKTNLQKALDGFPGGRDAVIHHRAFRLMPGEPPSPVEQMLARRYGQTPQQARESQRNVEGMAAQAGLEFHLDGTWCGDTTDAHVLLSLAADKGAEADLLDRFYRAYFTEGRSVIDRQSLMALGEEAGLMPDEMQAALESDERRARVDADQRQAEIMRMRGVPFVLIDQQFAVSGAQPPEVFHQALEAAAKAAPAIAADDADACGVDNCGVPGSL
ncbi:MAG: DsbA family oxidoreductase [Asticcacaulis sp.]